MKFFLTASIAVVLISLGLYYLDPYFGPMWLLVTIVGTLVGGSIFHFFKSFAAEKWYNRVLTSIIAGSCALTLWGVGAFIYFLIMPESGGDGVLAVAPMLITMSAGFIAGIVAVIFGAGLGQSKE